MGARRLFALQVNAASLAAFRILFGSLMAVSMIRFMAHGWVDEFYVQPTYHFTWELMPWVRPLPGPLMHALFAVLIVLAIAIAAGAWYRVSAWLFFLGFTYIELIDKTTYLNHYYLVSLLAGLLSMMPAHRVWSVDAWRRHTPDSSTIPAWTINTLRFQIALVYLFAGLAKINTDWLRDAEPLRIWLAARSDLPVVGPFLAEWWAAYAFSWLGAAYDLTIVAFLLRSRTRPAAYVTVVVFHLMTALLFPIGMFPWIMIAATLIFFSPEWPRRWIGGTTARDTNRPAPVEAVPTWVVLLVALYASIQVVMPLRAYWPDSEPEWTYRNFNFSWRVMLVEKAGHVDFTAFDPSVRGPLRVRTRDYVTERQEKMMAQDPFMVRDLARHIAGVLRARGLKRVVVRAESYASLNGRAAQLLIDPRVDLAGPLPADWIVPLQRDEDDRAP